jgi:hypothetical protein
MTSSVQTIQSSIVSDDGPTDTASVPQLDFDSSPFRYIPQIPSILAVISRELFGTANAPLIDPGRKRGFKRLIFLESPEEGHE